MARPMLTSPGPQRRPGKAIATAGTCAVLGASLGLNACGSADTVRVPGSKVELRLDEYRILPRSLSVRPGRLKLVARNTGLLTHNVRVESEKPAAGPNPVVFGSTPTAHPGETVTTKLTLSPGRYRLLCTLGNHADLGQRATLIVG
jgi:plastocyanin